MLVVIKKRGQHQFTKQFQRCWAKTKELQHVMDNIYLKEIDHLSKTDTTDKNSKEFKALKEDVKTISYLNFKHIISQQVFAWWCNEVKKLKKYMTLANEKKDAIYQLKKIHRFM